MRNIIKSTARPPSSSPEASRRMAATRGTDNLMERAVRKILHQSGLRYRKQRRLIPGSTRTVDIVFPRIHLAVFIDGCFWHSCPKHKTVPKSNAVWWRKKLAENRIRDKDTNKRLTCMGWNVIRIWEHEKPPKAALKILKTFRLLKRQS